MQVFCSIKWPYKVSGARIHEHRNNETLEAFTWSLAFQGFPHLNCNTRCQFWQVLHLCWGYFLERTGGGNISEALSPRGGEQAGGPPSVCRLLFGQLLAETSLPTCIFSWTGFLTSIRTCPLKHRHYTASSIDRLLLDVYSSWMVGVTIKERDWKKMASTRL